MVKLVFASGGDELNPRLVEEVSRLYPEIPLWVVSEFPVEHPAVERWIRYRMDRGLWDNFARCRSALRGRRTRLAACLLVPNVPYRRMRLLALLLSPRGFLAYNENFGSFMLRPRSAPAMARHAAWRVRNFIVWQWRRRGSERPPRVAVEAPVEAPAERRRFAGRAASGKPVLAIATPYLPFPLAHGGAVRIYNLLRRAAEEFDIALISFAAALDPPPPELLELCVELKLVRRAGSHLLARTRRPEMVEEFDSAAFRAGLRSVVERWRPFAVQLEFTQMAQYADACAPARTVLVEHDITFDLHEQLLTLAPHDYDLRRETRRWREFETKAWRRHDVVIAMSERDRARVAAGAGEARAVCLPNGVDVARFRPAPRGPELRRLLLVGSFAHLPNLLALEWFLDRVWPLLDAWRPTLHVIAGPDPELYLERFRPQVRLDLARPGVEVESFVADVRPAYAAAEAVIAPLVASAGTNIKVLEAMAMGKAVVSTPAGVNGLPLRFGHEVLIAATPEEFAAALAGLFENPARRVELERRARAAAERDWSWDAIAARQNRLYRELAGVPERPAQRRAASA